MKIVKVLFCNDFQKYKQLVKDGAFCGMRNRLLNYLLSLLWNTDTMSKVDSAVNCLNQDLQD